MGKKKIQSQSEQEVLKEKEIQESAQKKVSSAEGRGKRVERGKAYIHSTYNNTIVTICDNRGDVLAWASAGALGFRGPKKATPYAASKTVETLIEKIRKVGLKDIEIFVKGIGSGRESAIRALASHGLNILAIKDVTPVPHNGCRPRKVRRV
ncbi:30S ribosomal protein S11 [Patescibacteria group bacterium]|nr:30S ribosomal protein S11 [Patescibacteria group bacterium]